MGRSKPAAWLAPPTVPCRALAEHASSYFRCAFVGARALWKDPAGIPAQLAQGLRLDAVNRSGGDAILAGDLARRMDANTAKTEPQADDQFFARCKARQDKIKELPVGESVEQIGFTGIDFRIAQADTIGGLDPVDVVPGHCERPGWAMCPIRSVRRGPVGGDPDRAVPVRHGARPARRKGKGE